MEYLRQIEEDLQALGNEGGKKYSEVAAATKDAVDALRFIREAYVSEIRKKDSSSESVKFKPSSELVSPYILVCNHADCSQKLLLMSINGLLLLLKYDLVPPSDVQNILRVLQIQVQKDSTSLNNPGSKSGSGFMVTSGSTFISSADYILKILQLLVQLVTAVATDKRNYLLLSEQTIITLLTVSLSLTENRYPASVTTAALGTSRQIIAIIMDALSHANTEENLNENDPNRTATNEWIIHSAALIVREMSLIMQNGTFSVASSNHGTGMIKVTSVPASFAMDCLFDILTGWKSLFLSHRSLQQQLYLSVIPSLQHMLKNLHTDFHLQLKKGLTTASSFTTRAVQISRFILLEFWSTEEYDDLEHMITLLLHGTLPMRDPFEESDGSGSLAADNSRSKSGNFGTYTTGEPSITLRNRIEEASTLFSKLLGSAPSTTPNTAGKVPLGANKSSTSLSGIGNSGSGSSGSLEAVDVYIILERNFGLSSPHSSTSNNEGKIVPAHPAGCCIEALLSLLMSRSVQMMNSEVGVRCLLNLLSHLATYSSNLIISILSNEVFARDWERIVQESSLFRVLQEVVEEETIERESSNPTSEDPTSGVSPQTTDLGKAIHHAILTVNTLKSSDVCVLSLFSLMYTVKIFLRLSVFSKANESLPITSRLSDGSKYLFIPAVIDSLLISSLTSAMNENDSRLSSSLLRLQSSESIQLMRNHAENVYESVLDASTVVMKVSHRSDAIRCATAITSQLAVTLGLLGLHKPCEITISVICKQSMPLWHGKELLSTIEPSMPSKDRTLHSTKTANFQSGFQMKHLQILVSLLQLMHVMSDLISDWDCIVDCLEQFHNHFHQAQLQQLSAFQSTQAVLQSSSVPGSLPSPTAFSTNSSGAASAASKILAFDQMERLMELVEKWKDFTRFLSTETLIKLMTSLVALSMNNVAMNAATIFSTDPKDATPGPGTLTRDSSETVFPFDISDIKRSSSNQRIAGPFHSQIAESDPPQKGGSAQKTSVWLATNNNPSLSSAAKLNYLQRGMKHGCVSFSLQSVIEISKKNAYRVSSIWQMVTSHLRMMASMKSESSRSLSVMAIYDIIFAVIDQQFLSVEGLLSGSNSVDDIDHLHTSKILNLEELFYSSFIWKFLFPSVDHLFEVNFLPREGQNDRTISSMSGKTMPTLSQNDILSCLKSLSVVRYVDVRVNILKGLEHFLQEMGQGLSVDRETGGWKVVLELISCVPLSMTDESRQLGWGSTPGLPPSVGDTRKEIETIDFPDVDCDTGKVLSLLPQYLWPKETLYDAFNCISLIVDEFMDAILLDMSLIQAVLESLSLFGSQHIDINTSLTAVEMIWKVADAALKAGVPREWKELANTSVKPETMSDLVQRKNHFVMDRMLSLLFVLSMDERPELRHCAINTLFSAMAANSQMLKVEQWQKIFETIIFPLFAKTGERSKIAMKSQEEAVAPELKKGVKISMHHSRDSAHKQWSETRVLTLRGMLRLLRTCTKFLLCEVWFHEIWTNSILICDQAILVAEYELEVAIAGVDVFFGMLSVISDFASDDELVVSSAEKVLAAAFQSSSSSPSKASLSGDSAASAAASFSLAPKELQVLEIVEKSRSKLWNLTFKAVQLCALHCYNNVELAIALCNKLDKLYQSNLSGAFRYNANNRLLLTILLSIARPVVKSEAGVQAPAGGKRGDDWTRRGQASELRRLIVSFFRKIKVSDVSSLELFLTALSEISFAHKEVVYSVPINSIATLVHSAEGKSVLSSSQHSGDADKSSLASEQIVFSAVSNELREELGQILFVLLDLLEAGALPAEKRLTDNRNSKAESGGDRKEEGDCNISISLFQPTSGVSFSTVFSVIFRRYFFDICVSPLCQSMRPVVLDQQFLQSSGASVAVEAQAKFFYLLLADTKYFHSLASASEQSSLQALLEYHWNHLDQSNSERNADHISTLSLLSRLLTVQYPQLSKDLGGHEVEAEAVDEVARWQFYRQTRVSCRVVFRTMQAFFTVLESNVNASTDCLQIILLVLFFHLSPRKTRARDSFTSASQEKETNFGKEVLEDVFSCASRMVRCGRVERREKVQLTQILLGCLMQSLFIVESGQDLSESFVAEVESYSQLMLHFSKDLLQLQPPLEDQLRQNLVYSFSMISRQIIKILVGQNVAREKLVASGMDYLTALSELSSTDGQCLSIQASSEDPYFAFTRTSQPALEEKQRWTLWHEILNHLILLQRSPHSSKVVGNDFHTLLFRLVEDYCEEDFLLEREKSEGRPSSSSLRLAPGHSPAEQVGDRREGLYSIAAIMLYDHLVALLSGTEVSPVLRQRASSLLKQIDVVQMMQSLSELSRRCADQSSQLEAFSQELKTIRSATSFPF